jgi:hypothetical protein
VGRSRKEKAGREQRGVSFDTVRKIARELPGAVEGSSYGTPAFYVGRTLFVRQHQDGESLVVRIEPGERALLVRANSKTYSVTDHYVNHPLILVRMASVERKELQELVKEAWRLGAAIDPGGRRRPRNSSGGAASTPATS